MSTNLQIDKIKTRQVRLNSDLHKRLKLLAVDEESKLQFFVDKFIKEGLENYEKSKG